MRLSVVAMLAIALCCAEALRLPNGKKGPRHVKQHIALKPTATTNYPGVFGLDISSDISKSINQGGWSCVVSQGNYTCEAHYRAFIFAIIEGWQGGYGYNTFLPNAVAMAWAGGMQHVDVYAFMCPQCSGNGPSAVAQLVNNLRGNSVKFGMIWIDVEQCDGCWSGDLNANCAWIGSLIDQYKAMGINLGIYASPYEWGATVGSGCNYSGYPLWWADYNGDPSFNGFSSFGGWSSPSIHQFADSAGNSCGISIDRNWFVSRAQF